MVISSGMGEGWRVQAGGEGEGKKGEADLPQGAGAPRQGDLKQDEELFLVRLLRSRHLWVIC